MNPVMKDRFYGKGNADQVAWVERFGGLNDQEIALFECWHLGKTDTEIEEILNLDKDARIRLESLVIPKITAAVLYAISFAAAHERKPS